MGVCCVDVCDSQCLSDLMYPHACVLDHIDDRVRGAVVCDILPGVCDLSTASGVEWRGVKDHVRRTVDLSLLEELYTVGAELIVSDKLGAGESLDI